MQSKSRSNNDCWGKTLLSPVRWFQTEIPASGCGPCSGYWCPSKNTILPLQDQGSHTPAVRSVGYWQLTPESLQNVPSAAGSCLTQGYSNSGKPAHIQSLVSRVGTKVWLSCLHRDKSQGPAQLPGAHGILWGLWCKIHCYLTSILLLFTPSQVSVRVLVSVHLCINLHFRICVPGN